MTVETTLERLQLLRMSSAIERCHAKAHLLRYSNGHHTHDVTSLIILCWMEEHDGKLPRAELLVAAHTHDAGEIVTGDVPSPIKDLLGKRLHDVDQHVEQWLNLHQELTEEERDYLDAADRFELWLWCWEEHARGNVTFLDWIQSYDERWRKNPLPAPFERLRRVVEYRREVGVLTREQLNEAGGLD